MVRENVHLGRCHTIGLCYAGPAPGAHHGRALGFGVLADRVPVDAQLPGDCPNGEAPKLSLLHGLPPNPLSRRGFPAWRCRRLANSAAAVQCGAVGLDGVEGCQALLGVAAHAVDPTVKAGAISERTIGGTENSRARRRLLCGDRASPVRYLQKVCKQSGGVPSL